MATTEEEAGMAVVEAVTVAGLHFHTDFKISTQNLSTVSHKICHIFTQKRTIDGIMKWLFIALQVSDGFRGGYGGGYGTKANHGSICTRKDHGNNFKQALSCRWRRLSGNWSGHRGRGRGGYQQRY